MASTVCQLKGSGCRWTGVEVQTVLTVCSGVEGEGTLSWWEQQRTEKQEGTRTRSRWGGFLIKGAVFWETQALRPVWRRTKAGLC